ncbi:MAG: hypothetical protein AB7V45_03910 [Candidatus Krumholzibacteriia bacterium]
MRFRPIMLILPVILAGGCSSDDDPTAPLDPGPRYTQIASATIGPAGGEITGDQLTLSVPAAGFTGDATVTIAVSDDDRPFGVDQATRMYRIDGLPDDYDQPLQLTIEHGAKTEGDQTFVVLGEEAFCRSRDDVRTSYRILPSTGDGETITAVIPAPDPGKGTGAGAGSGGFWFGVGVITGYSLYTTPQGHFRIGVPLGHLHHYVEMGSYLEEAYDRFRTLGFSYSARTNWPVDVTLKSLEDDGGAMSSKLGDDHGYLELALEILDDLPMMRTTCAHEFFHIVQGFYDPRAPMIQADGPSRHYWLDEAAAVWSEEFFTSVTDYVSPVRNSHQMAPFAGMQKGAEENARHHGYGMSAVIKYLADRYGQTFVATVYGDIRNEVHPVEAVCRNDPAGWWEVFMSDYVLGNVYDDVSRATWFVNAEDKWTIAAARDTLKTWTRSYSDLSGAIYQISLGYVGLKPSDQLIFTLTGAENRHLSLFRYNTSTLEFLSAGYESVAVPDILTMTVQGWNLFALVTDNMYDDPYTVTRPITLKAHIPGGIDLSAANHCRVEIEDVYVTYLYVGGSTADHAMYETFEAENGTWNGNTFTGSSPSGIEITIDPATGRITSYVVREVWGATVLEIEGALPVAPDTSDHYYLAEFNLTGTGVCANITDVDFSNSWGTVISDYHCDGISHIRFRFWRE